MTQMKCIDNGSNGIMKLKRINQLCAVYGEYTYEAQPNESIINGGYHDGRKYANVDIRSIDDCQHSIMEGLHDAGYLEYKRKRLQS